MYRNTDVKLTLYTLQATIAGIYESHNLYGQLQILHNEYNNEFEFRYMNYLIFKKDPKDLVNSADKNIVELIKQFDIDAMIRSQQMFPTGVVIQ